MTWACLNAEGDEPLFGFVTIALHLSPPGWYARQRVLYLQCVARPVEDGIEDF